VRVALDRIKNYRIVFLNVAGVGYKRLSDAETATTGVNVHRKKLFRGSKRGLRTAAAVQDTSRLTGEERTHLWANRSLFAAIHTSAHGSAVRAKAAKAPPSVLEQEVKKLRARRNDGEK